MLAAELLEVMSHRATNVDEQGRTLSVLVEALDELLLDGEETFVHPRGPALVVAAHVAVELDAQGRVGLQVLKEVELGVVGELVGPARDAIGGLPVVLVGPEVEPVEGLQDAAGPGGLLMSVSTSSWFSACWHLPTGVALPNDGDGHGLGEVGALIGI